jgi:hypothetical protein
MVVGLKRRGKLPSILKNLNDFLPHLPGHHLDSFLK